jgi:hypothetical protein
LIKFDVESLKICSGNIITIRIAISITLRIANNKKKNAMPLELGRPALEHAGYPLALIESMQKIAREMGDPIISARMGNPPRIDLPAQDRETHSVATKDMGIKTKTTSFPGPLKGLIPKNQLVFGRAGSVPTPESSTYVSCPASLGQMLDYIKNGDLHHGIKIRKITDKKTGESSVEFIFKPRKKKHKNKPKKFGNYQETDGKALLDFSQAHSIKHFRYVIKVTQSAIPCRTTSREVEAEKGDWGKTYTHKKPRWWNTAKYGKFHALLGKQVPLHVQYQRKKMALQEEAMVLANADGAIITGDCDLFAVSISQKFLDGLSSELQTTMTTPLNLSKETDCEKMLQGLHDLRISLLEFELENASGNEHTALAEKQAELCKKDIAQLKNEVEAADGWKAYFGNITGIITPYELEFNLRVNREFREQHKLDHIGQFLHHGPENRNPGKPSEMKNEPMLHITADGKVFQTHDEAELTSFFKELHQHPDNAYFTDVHPRWEMGAGWSDVIAAQLKSHSTRNLLSPEAKQAYEASSSSDSDSTGTTTPSPTPSRKSRLSPFFRRGRTPSPKLSRGNAQLHQSVLKQTRRILSNENSENEPRRVTPTKLSPIDTAPKDSKFATTRVTLFPVSRNTAFKRSSPSLELETPTIKISTV